MSDSEIKKIYSQVLIRRDQAHKELDELMNKTLGTRLTQLFSKYWELITKSDTPTATVDQAKREMSKFLEDMAMHTDHEVIMILTNNLITQKYKAKVIKN